MALGGTHHCWDSDVTMPLGEDFSSSKHLNQLNYFWCKEDGDEFGILIQQKRIYLNENTQMVHGLVLRIQKLESSS